MSEETEEKTVVEEPEKVNPAPETTPPPVPESHAPDNAVMEVISELKEKVAHLEDVVDGLTSTEGDSTPTSLPWTHRGGRR